MRLPSKLSTLGNRALSFARKALHVAVVLVGVVFLAGALGCAWLTSKLEGNTSA